MAISDWSTVADDNTTIDGINIDENCPPSNVNNALRAIMAGVAGGDFPDDSAIFTFLAEHAIGGAGIVRDTTTDLNTIAENSIIDGSSANPNAPSDATTRMFYVTRVRTADTTDRYQWAISLDDNIRLFRSCVGGAGNYTDWTLDIAGVHQNVALEYLATGGGLDIRTLVNAADYILRVLSSDGTQRLRVEHEAEALIGTGDGWTIGGDTVIDEGNIGDFVEVGLYTGSSNSETSFPTGHSVLAYGGQDLNTVVRNSSATVYLQSSNSREYLLDSSGTQLAGTWRSRGAVDIAGENRLFMMQRVA